MMTRKNDTENSKGNKKRPSRRQFLQYAGLAAGGGSLLAATPELLSEGVVKGAVAQVVPEAPLPPHRAILVDGTHAYADQLSVKPGDDINFHVSSEAPYAMQIYRLGTDPNTPGSDYPMSGSMQGDPLQQKIHPGSYVHVRKRLGATDSLRALTLECWVRPFVGVPIPDPFNYTGLITQFDLQSGAGYGLFVRFDINDFVAHGGSVAFYLGNGGAFAPANLLEVPVNFRTADTWAKLKWHHIVATWNGTTKELWIDGEQKATQWFAETVRPGPAPLRLAACGENSVASRFLNGDLAMPVIYNRALSSDTIKKRFDEKGLKPPPLNGVLGFWPLSEEQGDDVADMSRDQERPGRIINHATWMIGGPSFSGEAAQFEPPYDPTDDPDRGHGLRFAPDDLFDCRWQVTQTYTVPTNARSGIYVARLTYTDAGQDAYYHVTFIVQKSANQKPAPILLVCPTNTWLAYNSRPFFKKQYEPVAGFPLFQDRYVNTDRSNGVSSGVDFPDYSCYLGHQNFAPPYHFGLLLPQEGADPYNLYASVGEYSHLTRATRFTQAWLETSKTKDYPNGYPYDVISDLDLHNTPGILQDYKTVIVAGHSEYWSIAAYNGVKSYLEGKGRLIVLSGNTMYWRVSFSPDGTVMECRKVDGAGAEVAPNRRGETWHSDDGLRGGLMRECGFPGWQLTGLETYGILSFGGSPDSPAPAAGDVDFGTFNVANPDHFLFKGVGVTAGQSFAQYTVGHETDARVSTLKTVREKSHNPLPPGAADPDEPGGITTLANGHKASGNFYDYFDNLVRDEIVTLYPEAELIYWQRPDGGLVFNGGAVGNGIALYYQDPVFTGLMKNVLTYFLGP